jgi:DNA-binding transcriptional regulator LsrR (DeoR family)
MPQDITEDQVVATARDLDQEEFTRADLAEKLGVEKTELSKPFRQARRAGRLDKVRDDDEGTGHFRLTGK